MMKKVAILSNLSSKKKYSLKTIARKKKKKKNVNLKNLKKKQQVI